MPNHKHLTPLPTHLARPHRPHPTMISVAFRWLLSPAGHKRQCRPSHSILIDILPCKVLPCPNASSQVPDRPVPALFAFKSLCMYVFKLVGLPGDPHFLVSQCVRCIRQCKLHMSMASPVNESLVGYDVYPNILTFTPLPEAR